MRTIPQLFENSVGKFPDNILIREKIDGDYIGFTYRTIAESVYALAVVLIELGIEKGDRIALLSEGRSEWLISELAVLYAGAVSVPISTKINEPDELQFRLQHSESRFVIVSGGQKDKVYQIRSSLASLEKVIMLDETAERKNSELSLHELITRGKTLLDTSRAELTKRWQSISEDDLANISYTSGTTADPKGIMLTHRNYTANLEQANSLFDVPEWYTTLLILSWDHSFAHTTGLYVMIRNGASIGVVEQGKTPMESLRNIPGNIREIRPVFLLSVPALARSFRKNIEANISVKGRRTEKLFHHALKLSYRYHGDGQGHKSPGQLALKPLIWFYDKLIFSKIRKGFGGRLKFFIGGGALLDLELQRFFYAIGIPMYQGYGLSEASPVISSNTPEKHRLGTSGRLVKNLELKILDEEGNTCSVGKKGEILVKGENVMKGYWKNPAATAETLRDGWLHTGDMGYMDADDFLHVLGRFKSLLIGNDGEKYSPEGIEETLIDQSEVFDQCMLYNNQDPYTVGLFVVHKAALMKNLKEQDIDSGSQEAVEASLLLIQQEFSKYKGGGEFENLFPQRWLPAAVGILEEPFTEENGLINSTLKMVRNKVTARYQEMLDYLYTTEGKRLTNERNRRAVQKIISE